MYVVPQSLHSKGLHNPIRKSCGTKYARARFRSARPPVKHKYASYTLIKRCPPSWSNWPPLSSFHTMLACSIRRFVLTYHASENGDIPGGEERPWICS